MSNVTRIVYIIFLLPTHNSAKMLLACLRTRFTENQEKCIMKKFSLVLLMALLLSITTAAAGQATGCPEGLWTHMTAELTSACAGELAGTVVTMSSTFTEGDEVKFNEAIAEFEGWT